MSEDGRTDKTFFIRTPADLLEKLHWEANALWRAQPFDLQQRAYMVMNCAITAWQMKDWVYNTLEASGHLDNLVDCSGQHIDFDAYIKDAIPQIMVARQIATASKHQIIKCHNDPTVWTTVRPVHIELRGGYLRNELFVVDGRESMLAHELVQQLYIQWKKVLHDLGLIPKEEPFVPDGDMQLPHGTPRLRRKRSQ